MKEEKNIIINELRLYQLKRSRQDIADWRTALQQAESIVRPKRFKLLEMYNNILSDSYLHSLIHKRMLACISEPILFYNNSRELNEEASDFINKSWFSQLVKWIVESVFFGFTLIEFNPFEQTFNIIPRHHVLPEQNKVLIHPLDESGIYYNEEPYNQTTLFFGNKSDLGILMQACPIVLYKRGSMADWATFCELFGMPIREYIYNPNNPQSKLEAEKAAKEAGAATYILNPDGNALKLHNGIGGVGNDVYERFRNAMNEELSVLILGQTMTTLNGSSRSQAEVHERQQDLITKSDKNMIETTLNEIVLPFLKKFEIIKTDGYFAYETKEKIGIDEIIKLSNVYHIPASYIMDRFGVYIQEKKDEELNKTLSFKKKSQIVRTLSFDDAHKEMPIHAFYESVKNNLIFDKYSKKERDLLHSLQLNAIEFGAARLLHLEKVLKGKNEEQKEVILEKYKEYFEVENQHFIACSLMASQWLDFEKRAEEFPLLKYVTAQDDFVRPNHKALANIILPINHPFWENHVPPLGYRCRCVVQQVKNEEITKEKDIPKEKADSPLFENNPAKSGKAFKDSHTYFEEADKEKLQELTNKLREELINKQIDKEVNVLKKQKKQSAILIDNFGNKFLKLYFKKDKVFFEKKDKELLKDSVLIYNSFNQPLNESDLFFASRFNVLKIIVVFKNKKQIIHRPKEGWLSESEIVEIIERLGEKYYEAYQRGDISLKELRDFLNKALFKQFKIEEE